MRRLMHDRTGAGLVGFVLVLPGLLIFFFAVIEFAIAMQVWTNATKATHWGARFGVVNAPVASGMQFAAYNGEWGLALGTSCKVRSGTAIVNATDENGVVLCRALRITCTPTATAGTCRDQNNTLYPWNETAFQALFQRMRWAHAGIEREQVRIEYSTNGLGFIGRPGGLPLTVTVSTRCLSHEWVLLHGLLPWALRLDDCGQSVRGLILPPMHTTLTGESYGSTGI